MPKVRPLTRPDPDRAKLLAWVGGGITAMQIGQGELAAKIGISQATMSKRMAEIETMTVSELLAIKRVFRQAGLPEEIVRTGV